MIYYLIISFPLWILNLFLYMKKKNANENGICELYRMESKIQITRKNEMNTWTMLINAVIFNIVWMNILLLIYSFLQIFKIFKLAATWIIHSIWKSSLNGNQYTKVVAVYNHCFGKRIQKTKLEQLIRNSIRSLWCRSKQSSSAQYTV